MSTSRLQCRFLILDVQNFAAENEQTASELRVAAQFLEDLIKVANTEQEKLLCRELVNRYRAAARKLLRTAWSADEGHDIA